MPRITVSRPPSSVAIPVPPLPYGELLDEYPELTAKVMGLTSWRDTNQPDRRSKNFDRMFPSLEPRPWVGP